jgi:hypothetical protein
MTQAAEIKLAPLTDFSVVVGPLKSVPSTGTKAAITTDTVTGFLATSKSSSATAADATLSASCTYVGGNSDGEGGTYEAGMWLFQLDASVLTVNLLSTHFAATPPYLIISRSNDLRWAFPVVYRDALVGIVEA